MNWNRGFIPAQIHLLSPREAEQQRISIAISWVWNEIEKSSFSLSWER